MKHTLTMIAALLFVRVVSLHAGDGFPDFSWEQVPLHAHLGIDDGLSQDQCTFLADHFSMITFPLACFLVGAERHCYFCYTWGWLGKYGTFDWYPEFDKPLGPPKGEAVRNGWTYQREFEHASVFVDLEQKTARINWK